MKDQSTYLVILAGGKGERLWPLSREKKPKQLLSCASKNSLLELTIDRVKSLVDKKNIWVVTTECQAPLIEKAVKNKVGRIITEPASRNTAPAILLSCLKILEQDKNALVGFLSADHFILEDEAFREALTQALNFSAKNRSITLIGLKPQWPATNYGYIESELKKTREDLPLKVVRFHEKPSIKTADLYFNMTTMLWNIGVFCGQVSFFIEEYKKNSPKLFKGVEEFLKKNGDYTACENISVDHALIEKSASLYVVPAQFTWSDVGNLDIFLSLHTKYKKRRSKVVEINSQSNIVDVPKKLVALIGVENLCIVETEDVLLIAKRDQTDNVKQILNELRKENNLDYL